LDAGDIERGPTEVKILSEEWLSHNRGDGAAIIASPLAIATR
jgi:hypothetical protein